MNAEVHGDPLAGTTAVVSGGSSGIGLATARLLAHGGCRVALLARDRGRLDRAVQTIRGEVASAVATAHSCDVTDSDAVRRAVAQIVDKHGGIDSLVNCAGFDRDFARIMTADAQPSAIEDLERVIDTDLLGTARLTFCVEPLLRVRGRGTIVNLAATPLLDRRPDHLIYQVARSGVVTLTEVLARQHRAAAIEGVRAYCVALGNVFNPSTFAGMSPTVRKMADDEGWLDSFVHVAPTIVALLSGRLVRADGALLRVDVGTVRELFQEMNLDCAPFSPPRANG
ncbi:MAG: SDR family oxidoreductase [Planctomycetota bacterium]